MDSKETIKKINMTNKCTEEQWHWSGFNDVYSFAEKNRQIGKHSSATKVIGSIGYPWARNWTVKSPEAAFNSQDDCINTGYLHKKQHFRFFYVQPRLWQFHSYSLKPPTNVLMAYSKKLLGRI